MSTPTTIQAHIAFDLMDEHDRGVVVSTTADHFPGLWPVGRSDSSRFNRAGHQAETGYELKKVALESSEKRVADAGAASIDDFGGRSDALGG